VPKLKGRKLKAARKALRNAHCTIGKITGPKGKTALVTKQKPKPGSVLSAGSKVNLTIKL
jgi:beta-lactam-binding protein with PASTA domain